MIVIIGAGPAGLAASYFATQPYFVVESEGEIGGLCRSFALGGCTFDLGGHALFTKHQDLLALFERKVDGGLYCQPRQAFVHSHGQLLSYPFQAHLFGLPQEVVVECLVGIAEANSSNINPETLAEWIEGSFGAGISKHFMLPYNEKVWAWPLEHIRSNWTHSRIVKPDVKSIIEGALGPRRYSNFDNAQVRYPNKGGFSEIYRPFSPPREKLILGTRVVAIDTEARTMKLSSGDVLPYSAIVSTAPLDALTRMASGISDEMKHAAQRLACNSLYLASFAAEATGSTGAQRIYTADPKKPFHKLVINSNSSPTLRQERRLGLQAEISFSDYKYVAADDLIEKCWSAIMEIGIIEPTAKATHSELRVIERAYPIATRESKGAPEFLIAEFERLGIFCAGRFGMWRYVNSDDAFHLGREAISKAQLFASG
jgi:protoporphyrinogen oxidase